MKQRERQTDRQIEMEGERKGGKERAGERERRGRGHMHDLPHYQHSHQSSIFITIDESINTS